MNRIGSDILCHIATFSSAAEKLLLYRTDNQLHSLIDTPSAWKDGTYEVQSDKDLHPLLYNVPSLTVHHPFYFYKLSLPIFLCKINRLERLSLLFDPPDTFRQCVLVALTTLTHLTHLSIDLSFFFPSNHVWIHERQLCFPSIVTLTIPAASFLNNYPSSSFPSVEEIFIAKGERTICTYEKAQQIAFFPRLRNVFPLKCTPSVLPSLLSQLNKCTNLFIDLNQEEMSDACELLSTNQHLLLQLHDMYLEGSLSRITQILFTLIKCERKECVRVCLMMNSDSLSNVNSSTFLCTLGGLSSTFFHNPHLHVEDFNICCPSPLSIKRVKYIAKDRMFYLTMRETSRNFSLPAPLSLAEAMNLLSRKRKVMG